MNNYITGEGKCQTTSQQEKISFLMQKFDKNKDYYISNDCCEAIIRLEFIDRLLSIFNWDVYNDQCLGLNEKDVIIEKSIDLTRPDYCLLENRKVKIVVEAKAAHVNIENESFITKIIQESISCNAGFALLTNFKDSILFDFSGKLTVNNDFIFKRLNYTEYLSSMTDLMFLLKPAKLLLNTSSDDIAIFETVKRICKTEFTQMLFSLSISFQIMDHFHVPHFDLIIPAKKLTIKRFIDNFFLMTYGYIPTRKTKKEYCFKVPLLDTVEIGDLLAINIEVCNVKNISKSILKVMEFDTAIFIDRFKKTTANITLNLSADQKSILAFLYLGVEVLSSIMNLDNVVHLKSTFKSALMGEMAILDNNTVDSVDKFIKECCVCDYKYTLNYSIDKQSFYDTYVLFCRKNKIKPLNHVHIGRKMKTLGFGMQRKKIKDKRVMQYMNIKLREESANKL